MYIRTCAYSCFLYRFTCIYRYKYVCMYVCLYVCIYDFMYVGMYVCIYLSMYVSIYLSIYVCMFVCAYIYTLYIYMYKECDGVRACFYMSMSIRPKPPLEPRTPCSPAPVQYQVSSQVFSRAPGRSQVRGGVDGAGWDSHRSHNWSLGKGSQDNRIRLVGLLMAIGPCDDALLGPWLSLSRLS